jgi:hypothetical protein
MWKGCTSAPHCFGLTSRALNEKAIGLLRSAARATKESAPLAGAECQNPQGQDDSSSAGPCHIWDFCGRLFGMSGGFLRRVLGGDMLSLSPTSRRSISPSKSHSDTSPPTPFSFAQPLSCHLSRCSVLAVRHTIPFLLSLQVPPILIASGWHPCCRKPPPPA